LSRRAGPAPCEELGVANRVVGMKNGRFMDAIILRHNGNRMISSYAPVK
jgi:hypothetical protein